MTPNGIEFAFLGLVYGGDSPYQVGSKKVLNRSRPWPNLSHRSCHGSHQAGCLSHICNGHRSRSQQSSS